MYYAFNTSAMLHSTYESHEAVSRCQILGVKCKLGVDTVNVMSM